MDLCLVITPGKSVGITHLFNEISYFVDLAILHFILISIMFYMVLKNEARGLEG